MLLTVSYSKSAYPVTPVEQLKATLYVHLGISVYYLSISYLYTRIYLHMKSPKLRNSDSVHFIC